MELTASISKANSAQPQMSNISTALPQQKGFAGLLYRLLISWERTVGDGVEPEKWATCCLQKPATISGVLTEALACGQRLHSQLSL